MTYRLIGFSWHGGGCCGAAHITRMSFGDDRWEGRLREITRVVEDLREPGRGKVLEIIMTDQQIRTSPNLTAGLKKLGFKLVTRFQNSSGGMCNVLHHRPHNKLHSSPYWEK